MTICPVCESGELTPQVEARPAEWEGRTWLVDLHYSVCSGCGSEIVDQAQSTLNKQNILAFRGEAPVLSGAEVPVLSGAEV